MCKLHIAAGYVIRPSREKACIYTKSANLFLRKPVVKGVTSYDCVTLHFCNI